MSKRLWRSGSKLPTGLIKGITDDSNLKNKVLYINTSRAILLLTGLSTEFAGTVLRQGNSLSNFFLVFPAEAKLNEFVTKYGVFLKDLPFLSVTNVTIGRCFYRFDDYLRIQTRSSFGPGEVVKTLSTNLASRCLQIGQSPLSFFFNLNSLLMAAKK